nr:unnamed protein product [Callosobruchus chinensis]
MNLPKKPKRVHSCCVSHCENFHSKRHSIPADSCLSALWLHRINNPKLYLLEQTKLKNYYVCQDHFDPMCLEKNGRLRRFSVPTLKLPMFLEMPKTPSVLSEEGPGRLELKKPMKVYERCKREPFSIKTEPTEVSDSENVKPELATSSNFFESVIDTSAPAMLFEFVAVDTV